MGNSNITLQTVVDYCKTYPELNPVLATGGQSQQPALTIATDVMEALLSPAFPWRWNRFRLPYVYTNSYQQDYAVPGLVNLSWLEHGVIIDINSAALPKGIWTLETNRDLELTAVQYGRPGQVCWLPNDQLTFGTWAALSSYGARLNVPNNPINPLIQLQDSFGNLWVLNSDPSTNVITGSTNPFTTNLNPVYPTPDNPTLAATTANDGTAQWIAVNPKGQGLRINPIPPQTGVVYQLNLIGQLRPVKFTSLNQFLEPIPDDFAPYFRRGFVAYTYMHAKDPLTAKKFPEMYQLWIESLKQALRRGDRERENWGLIPSEGIMQNPYTDFIGPANPFFPAGF